MQSAHFIPVLQGLYEAVYSAHQAGELTDAAESPIVETAIQAADCCAQHNWGDPNRAGMIAAALLRARYGADAPAQAEGLGAAVRLALANPLPVSG